MKDDTISRQAVFKLLRALPPEEATTKAMLIQSVKQMDAAQPEKRTDERTETHACDLIDRQMVIDTVTPFDDEYRIRDAIEDLPSVQPSSSCSHDAEQLEPEEPFEKCSNCIHDDDSEDICILRRCKHAIAETVECFEPKQPERKRGKWIIKDNPGTGWYRVTCSECGEDVTSTAPCIGFYPNAKVTWDYCPNCGADMREVSE